MNESQRSISYDAFAARIDALSHAAITNGATSFPALLCSLPSVYPTELLASLERLVANRKIKMMLAESIKRHAAIRCGDADQSRSLLPLPHPLDFEWRFAPDSARALLSRAADLRPAGSDLLLFGTPGLAVEALTAPIARRITFLGENNSVTDRVVALNAATGSPLSVVFSRGGAPRDSADAVVLDPPWYLDFVRPMLAMAAHACRVGGVVLISLPPVGTRPSAEDDRNAAIDLGQQLGLDLIEQSMLAIVYETPFFERNALAAAGIYTPPQWRRGDLVIFKKIHASTSHAIGDWTYPRRWIEANIGRMRFFIRVRSKPRSDKAGLTSLVEGDVLPTVSRRDPRRRLAQAWTSGNRIFQTDNPQLLLEAAVSCSERGINASIQPRLWGTIHEREALERVADELRALAALEAQEEQGAQSGALERSVSWSSRSMQYWNRSTAMISG